ncbi:hypothetical protein CXB51_016201 [Gossypium anomalum]|uniref:Reverse transcriptase Ty1/copia-type domain-containing protein n=1 Tax=Gossypium anomalum TaxID=47600 RepID=A0A8J6CXT0_9ROSI|nr:hypothetical protein CXB51_016201 [Gossypium anomalum]
MAKDCWSKKKTIESNAATSKSEEEWDAEALVAIEEEEQINYKKDWIVDSGCSNHMTDDKEKLQNLSKYKGNRVAVTASDSKLPIAHTGDTIISLKHNDDDISLQNVYYVLESPIMEGQISESVYVMSAEDAYVDRTRKNETTNLWHMRLGHVSYSKLDVMMKKSILRSLPELEVRTDAICAGCQCGKAHQLPYNSRGQLKQRLRKEFVAYGRIMSMLHAKNVQGRFWAEVMRTVIFVINHLPQQSEGGIVQNPWQTGVYQQPHEVVKHSEARTPVQLRRSTRKKKANPRYANVAIVEETDLVEPETFEEASRNAKWKKAMEEEITALRHKQTWELVPKPKDVEPVSCKWIYKLKRHTDGSIERHKARSVARGFSQQYGLDYDEMFSPVAKITTVRVLIAIAASKNWCLWQIDVKNAFLHGELDLEIYMNQPIGFQSAAHPDYVCKLRKALYGLKQALRAWYGKISEFLTHDGFSVATADSSLFVKSKGGQIITVLVYVNDLIVTGDWEEEILQTKENFSIRFQMKEVRQLKHFLGLEIDHTSEGILLHQQKYSRDLLKRFGMSECKPITTPVELNANICSLDGKDLEDVTMYRQLIGSLIYLTLTRPDISYAVGVMSRYMQSLKKSHLERVRRILRYVKGDHDTRCSTTRYVFMLGAGPISCCSKRQQSVSLSTAKAEYRAAAMAAQESTWLIQLLKDLKCSVNYAVPLFCDNRSAICLAENPVLHARTKHVVIRYHFIREKVLLEEIELKKVKTEDQITDVFTKGLSAKKVENYRYMLSMMRRS